MNEITSRQNSQFRAWLRLLTNKGLKKDARFLLSGSKLIREFAVEHPDRVEGLIGTAEHFSGARSSLFEALGVSAATPRFLVPEKMYAELDALGTDDLLLIGRQGIIAEYDPSSRRRQVVLALGDPGNLGSALRSCLAFGFDEVVLCEESANPYLPKALRAAGGATGHLRFLRGPSLQKLEPAAESVVLDAAGTPYTEIDWSGIQQVILGEEGQGIPQHLQNRKRAQIPIDQRIESLNAVTALGVVLAHQRMQGR